MVWRLKIVAPGILSIFSVKADFQWGYNNMSFSLKENSSSQTESFLLVRVRLGCGNKDHPGTVALVTEKFLPLWQPEGEAPGHRTWAPGGFQVSLPLGCCHAWTVTRGKKYKGAHPWSESLNQEQRSSILLANTQLPNHLDLGNGI